LLDYYPRETAMTRTLPPDPDDPAEVAAVQTPEGEPDGALLDPEDVEFTDEESEEVAPG
jgi:hypothetical protein